MKNSITAHDGGSLLYTTVAGSDDDGAVTRSREFIGNYVLVVYTLRCITLRYRITLSATSDQFIIKLAVVVVHAKQRIENGIYAKTL